MSIVIINGPNLNMLGERNDQIYGKETLQDIIRYTESKLKDKSLKLQWFQSNNEGEIIDYLHSAARNPEITGVVINPGGLSHSSVSLHDAIEIISVPVIEVHLSHIFKRESFRRKLITANACTGLISGIGKDCYHVAVYSLLQMTP